MKVQLISRILFLIGFNNAILLTSSFTVHAFVTSSHKHVNHPQQTTSSTSLNAHLSEPSTSTVGIVGRGYISVLTAKLAARAGYQTWMLYPPTELDTIKSCMEEDYTDLPSNLEFLAITDGDVVLDKLKDTDALILAVDEPENGVLDPAVIEFIINEETAQKLKRVAIMSRNLNGEGMGFLASVSKKTANNQVWAGEGPQVQVYKNFEKQVKEAVQKSGNTNADVVTVRAGTLKGGGCGDSQSDESFPQYLTPTFYQLTKKDIITWQLLFDCNVRGVKLYKGDTMPGPGGKAILTANSSEECDGDSSRCSVADALIKCLKVEKVKNMDFAVGTVQSRVPPTDEEWDKMLSDVLV